MTDLISRQDAIDALELKNNVITEEDYHYCSECDHIEMCRWYPMYGCEFRSRPLTVEELKKIANEMGYNIIKKQEYIKLLPCKCGCTRREHWYGVKKDDAYILKCSNCGAKAMGSTEREAKLNWNRMVSEDE